MATMRATVFHGPNDLRVEEVERPRAGVRSGSRNAGTPAAWQSAS